MSLYRRLGKRALDLALAVPALCVAMPVVTVAAVAVRATMGAPAFFVQRRPGLGGRPFSLIKLRTMRHATDQHGRLLDDAERLTPLGRVLRGASIDELPQLLNVVAGDMSLVGPRPLLMHYLGRYSEQQARRHEVKPGITGHAQVNGRNALGWDDKFRLDVWYVDHVGFGIDVAILAQTALKVVQRSGISAQGEATMREFMGTPSSSKTPATTTTTTTTTATETA